jgi:hypothetical protein
VCSFVSYPGDVEYANQRPQFHRNNFFFYPNTRYKSRWRERVNEVKSYNQGTYSVLKRKLKCAREREGINDLMIYRNKFPVKALNETSDVS